MIIHRLANAIRHQNWSQIITEILIVVIGIFLGLQVDDWNDDRKNAIDTDIYKNKLITDTRLAIQITEDALSQNDYLLKEVYEVLQVLEGKPLDDENRRLFINGLIRIKFYELPQIGLGLVGDIIGGNVPDFIEEEKLLSAISTLQHEYSFDLSRGEGVRTLLNNTTNELDKFYAPSFRYITPYEPGIGDIEAKYDLDELRSTPEVVNKVQTALSIHYFGRNPIRRIKSKLEEFLVELEAMQ